MLRRIYGGDSNVLASVFANDESVFSNRSEPSRSQLSSAFNFIFSPLAQARAITKTSRQAERVIKHISENGGADLLIGTTGAVSTLKLTSEVATRLSVPWIAHIFDDYVYQWIHPISRWIARISLATVMRNASAVVANNFVLADWIASRGIQREKIVQLRNPVPCDHISECGLGKKESEEFKILYTGNVYDAQLSAIQNMVSAVNQLAEQGESIRFDIYTRTPESHWESFGEQSESVAIHESVSSEEALRLQRTADLLFLPLAFRSRYRPPLINSSCPGKFGEYLASGVPMLVHAPTDSFPFLFCREHYCAFVEGTDCPTALAQSIQRARNGHEGSKIVTNAKRIAKEDFSERVVREKANSLISDLVGRKHDDVE